MRSFKYFLLSIVLFLTVLPASAQFAPPPPPPTVIHAGHMVDVASGTVIDNQQILIEGGVIQEVGSRVAHPEGTVIIDLSSSWVMPGLIDAHTHLALQEMDGSDLDDAGSYYYAGLIEDTAMRVAQGTQMARSMLETGFVWVRDTGNNGNYGDVTIRRAIQGYWVPGPNMVTAGRMIAPFGGQFQMNPEKPDLGEPEYYYADSHEEIILAVRENVHYGATVIKLIIDNQPYLYSEEDVRVAVEEAHAMGVKVMAHATSDEGIRNAVFGGVDSIEHAFDPSDDTLGLMAERGVYLVGTDFPAWRLGDRRYASNIVRNQKAYEMGVPMAFGSDAVYYEAGRTRGEQTLDFLRSYVDAGLPNEHILRMATMYAADLLGAESGQIVEGLDANIVAMPSNPLDDIEHLRGIDFVMKDGRVYVEGDRFVWETSRFVNNPRRKQQRGNMLGRIRNR